MTKWKMTILIICLFMVTLHADDTKVYRQVVNLSVKRVALLSRIMKNYTMLQMHNNYGDPAEDMKEAVEQYEVLCDSMLELPVDNRVKENTAKCQVLWKSVKTRVSIKPTKDNLLKLKDKLIPLRKKVREIVRYAKDKDGTKVTESMYYLGKLYVIPQKMASVYMLMKQSSRVEKAKKSLKEQANLYATVLSKLKVSLVSDTYQKQIKSLEEDFGYIKMLEAPGSVFVPALAYKKANAMSQKAHELVSQLAKAQ